ncbi:acyl-CoA carboxylase epsilon subunit [Arsenicicoccus dermatophilus]|uniref:acyl-CoA carboxylase epsilon subunit n=1 Tax=Arsenicicoccus dermatophilus TaxID=1076331 RepID=UPI003917470B
MSETTTTAPEATPEQPAALPTLLTVTKGDPTDEELAALLVVVAAASGDEADDGGPQHGIWASRARNLGVSSLGHRRRSSWAWRSAR